MAKLTDSARIQIRLTIIDRERKALRSKLDELDREQAELQTAVRVIDRLRAMGAEESADAVELLAVSASNEPLPAKGTLRHDLWEVLPTAEDGGWHRNKVADAISEKLGRTVSVNSTSAELSRLRKAGLANSVKGLWHKLNQNNEAPAEAGASEGVGVAGSPDAEVAHPGPVGSTPTTSTAQSGAGNAPSDSEGESSPSLLVFNRQTPPREKGD